MLTTSYGFVPWDDAHHPQLSQTDGVPDGRWLFINGNNTPRIARLDLTRFETEEILEIPNSAGNHASPFVTENTEYVVGGHALQRAGAQKDVSIDDYKTNFDGVLTLRQGGQRDRPNGDRLPDPAARLQLRPGPRRQGPVARLGVLHQLQHRAGATPSSK